MLTVNLAIQLVLLIALGIFVRKIKLVDDGFAKSLTAFIVNIALPCVIINSFHVEYSPDELKNCALVLILSVGLFGLLALLGQLGWCILGRDYGARVFRFGTIFSNFTFVGLPVIEALYGAKGLFYFVIMLLPFRMLYYSAARPMLSPPGAAGERTSFAVHLKKWLSPPVVAVFIGLLLYVTRIQLPSALSNTISSVGSVCSSMGMVLCGITLGKYEIRTLVKLKFLRLPVMRNFIVPAIVLLVVYFLPVDRLMGQILVVFSALPVASLVTAYTLQYDPDSGAALEGAGAVLLSTLLSAVTIPVWAELAAWLL